PAGHTALREAIAEHLAYARGVRCTAADVIVTQGAQQAFDLLVRVLVGPGDTAAIESPGYPPVIALLQAQGARIAPVPVDDEGLVTDALPPEAKLIYTTPAHQFPLGVAMSAARRRALLAWAARTGAVVIEDDYDSEFRFEGQPRDSLQGLDTDGRVAFVGSFSKTLAPSLRLGYVIAPPALRKALLHAKHLADVHGPSLLQHALARFMAEGHYRKHLRRCVAEYASALPARWRRGCHCCRPRRASTRPRCSSPASPSTLISSRRWRGGWTWGFTRCRASRSTTTDC
ncbi:MAG: PLP-dependent aminotransferase family protein, partial [Burkholderiales bacterium]|nr:PLP-dependent aminotransferase family protein [Burkholderiales bacterium]